MKRDAIRTTSHAALPRAAVLTVMLLAACEAPERPDWRRAEGPPSGAMTVPNVLTSEFQAGLYVPPAEIRNPYEGSIHEGHRFYLAFNCAGCHGERGGGGIGPPFVVADFIYGNRPEQIFQSIVQGRPNGMPAYGGKAPDEVIWKITAYVQSLTEPRQREAGDQGAGRAREVGEGGGP